ncbi:MAG: transporter ATP-binding protein, partial [Pseudonocardiales bacterium]|nr:transporter ATP-binding protein [Pseudonocardiales bacterium]
MSSPPIDKTKKPDVLTVPARIGPPPGGPPAGGGPFGRGIGVPTEKAMNFGPSARRLLVRITPERTLIAFIVFLSVASVTLSVIAPKILGHATDLIFGGILGRQVPGGVTRQQAIDAARARGDNRFADLLSGTHFTPGQGIDFTALGHIVLIVSAIYLASSLFSWWQGYLIAGVVNRTVYRLRSDVEDKLHRLPLSYFDRQPRGELLSRVTNDIDNVGTSLQQTMSQLLVSLLTVVGVVVLMFVISPLLALVALIAIPLSLVITTVIAKRSQKMFVAQWRHTGQLNAQIEETFTGHALVKMFGRQSELEATFASKNEELYSASFGAQFVSGIIMPAMMFVGNLTYVAIAVIGGLRVASGSASLGDVQA